ncbi:MAG: hypothetical protein WAL30_05595 [Candidatus Aquirickettsiella sp.]
MLHYLEQKSVLIVPLSSFIVFNKLKAGEKFAYLLGKITDDLLSSPEEIKAQEQFNEKLMQKILTSELVTNFNLGKITKDKFISGLLNFLDLPNNKADDARSAWNSLIDVDQESKIILEALIKLIPQGKSIYFIGNTDELHARKILDLFACFPFQHLTLRFLEDLPAHTRALPLGICQIPRAELARDALIPEAGKVYFCLSYAYKTMLEKPQSLLTKLFQPFKQTSGLLTHLKVYLNDIGNTKDDILLVTHGQEIQAITKKLALETISQENFFTDLIGMSPGNAVKALCHPKLAEVHPIPTKLAKHENTALQTAESSIRLSTHLQPR